MIRFRGALLFIVPLACQQPASNADTTPAKHPTAKLTVDTTLRPYKADSIVLQRSLCFGECPAYRVAVARNRRIHFESLTPGDSGRKAADSLATDEAFTTLAQHVFTTGFVALPDSIETDERFGGYCFTDNPTAVVTVYFGARSKRVVDYLGCRWGPAALRELEQRIDQVSGSQRWVRRARFGQ